jgi:hypothetical protein
MRKPFVLLLLLALALPVAGVAALRAGEGTLSVEDGRGKLWLQARGGLIGRIDRGSVTIWDLTPDANDPVVVGDDQPLVFVGDNGIRRAGTGMRFRLVGGSFRILINGKGIDLSVVGKGNGWIQSDVLVDPGLYSLNGDDCRKSPTSCAPLPDIRKVFQLGAAEKVPGRPDAP